VEYGTTWPIETNYLTYLEFQKWKILAS